jgi:hypothetical protein
VPLRSVVPAITTALALAATGCGGGTGSKSATSGRPAIKSPAKVELKAGLLGGATSAGAGDSYVPSGQIVADSGFRPDNDGFAFENYGNDAGPVNLRPANVEDIFGSQVCAAGTGTTCQLIPAALTWMHQANESMAGGHCMGFSVTALRFFTKALKPDPFGAPRTIALPVQGNSDLQSLIAEDFAYQSLPAVTDKTVHGTPSEVLRALIAALKADNETYTLGIFKADGTGGHAITPFAVEDKGSGQAEILVYDNNFPGVIRKVDVDTKADRWHYVGGINPSDTNEIYEGDASTKSMSLLPTTPGEGKQPCPFCPAKAKANPAYPVPDRLKYIEVALHGTRANHPHLLFTDEQGRRTGFTGGRFVNQVPGIRIVQNYSVQNWQSGAEPVFHLPLGHPQYTVTVDGAALRSPITTRITVNGGGVVFYINDLKMVRGQIDKLILPAKDLGIAYLSGRRGFPGSPTIGASFPQFDLLGKQRGAPKARLVTLGTGWIGLRPGDPIALRLVPQTGVAQISSPGGKRITTGAQFVVSLDSSPLGPGNPTHAYFGTVKGVEAENGQALWFHYLRPNGAKLPVDVLDDSGRTVRTVGVPSK